MRKLEYVDLKSDTTFKYLFKTERGRKWFEYVILHSTGVDISEYELYDNELNSGSSIKDYRLDLLLSNKDKDYIVIEMNNKSKSQMIKARYYLYRVAGKKFVEGEKYKNTSNILIAFNNFYNDRIKELKTANFIQKERHTNLEINDIDIHEIYLPNYHKICYDKLSEIEKKLYLFNCESFEEMEKLNLSGDDKYIMEELRRLSMDEKFYDEYDAEKVNEKLMKSEFEDGMEQGIEQGIEQGEKTKSIEIAKRMLDNSESIEKIKEYTKLTCEEIENIRNNNF